MRETTNESQALRATLDEITFINYKKMGDNVHRFRVLQRMTQDNLDWMNALEEDRNYTQCRRTDCYRC